MKLGFDKSSYDGTVIWKVSRLRNISFVTMRASEGLNEDKLYRTEYIKAITESVTVIPYHYYIPKKIPPQAQAVNFLSIMQGNPTRAMIDLEDYGNTIAYKGIAIKELKIWLDTVEAATNKKPFIYTSPNYIKLYLRDDTWLSEYPLVIANYQVAAPYVPAVWSPLDLAGWQYSMNSDAKYYGFEQAKSCALQIMYQDDIF